MSALKVGDRVRHTHFGRIGRVSESPAVIAGRPMVGMVRVTPEKCDLYSTDSLAGEEMFERVGEKKGGGS